MVTMNPEKKGNIKLDPLGNNVNLTDTYYIVPPYTCNQVASDQRLSVLRKPFR